MSSSIVVFHCVCAEGEGSAFTISIECCGSCIRGRFHFDSVEYENQHAICFSCGPRYRVQALETAQMRCREDTLAPEVAQLERSQLIKISIDTHVDDH